MNGMADIRQVVLSEKQSLIHGCPSRVRVGRGSDREGHLGIWIGVASSRS